MDLLPTGVILLNIMPSIKMPVFKFVFRFSVIDPRAKIPSGLLKGKISKAAADRGGAPPRLPPTQEALACFVTTFSLLT